MIRKKEGGTGGRGEQETALGNGIGKEREKQEEVGEKENEGPGQHLQSTGGR